LKLAIVAVVVVIMHRFFGVSKPKAAPEPEAPPPNLTETSARMDENISSINAKIKKCEEELLQLKPQLTRGGPAAAGVKQKMMTILKRKKMYEAQRDQVFNQQFTVDQVAFAQETMNTTLQTVDALKYANTAMKRTFNVTTSPLVSSVFQHLFNSFRVYLNIFSTRFECISASSPLVSSVFFSIFSSRFECIFQHLLHSFRVYFSASSPLVSSVFFRTLN
jgi:hypothetical protein